jgi:hypothetical protein
MPLGMARGAGHPRPFRRKRGAEGDTKRGRFACVVALTGTDAWRAWGSIAVADERARDSDRDGALALFPPRRGISDPYIDGDRSKAAGERAFARGVVLPQPERSTYLRGSYASLESQ